MKDEEKTREQLIVELGELRRKMCALDTRSSEHESACGPDRNSSPFAQIYDEVPLPWQSLDEFAAIIDVNQAWLDSLGYSKQEVLGRNLGDFIHPDWVSNFKECFERFNVTGQCHAMVLEMLRRDGASLFVSCTGKIRRDPLGNFLQTQCIFQDITQRRKAEQELQAAFIRQRSIVETAMDGFWLADLQGRLIEVNDVYCRMSGYSEQELLTMKINDLEVLESPFETAAHIQKIVASGEDRFQSRHKRKDGYTFDVEVSVKYRPEEGGQFVCFLRDITESRKSQEALKESEEGLRSLIEATPDIVCFKAGDGRWLEANHASLELFGLNGVDYRGRTDSELAQCEGASREALLACAQSDKTAWQKGAMSRAEEAFFHSDSAPRIYDVIKVPMFHCDGRRKGLVVLARDITERKRMEESLREREAQLKMAMDIAGLVPWEYDFKTGKLYFDEQFYPLYGDARRGEFGAAMTQEAQEAHIVAQELAKGLAANDPSFTGRIEYRIIGAKGEKRYILVHYAPERDQAGRVVKTRGANQDITERKRAEIALRESNERLAQILDFLPDPTFAIDLEGKVIAWNKAYESISGRKAEDILGKGDYEYALPFYGYRRPVLIDAALRQDDEILEKYCAVRKEGDIFLAETRTSINGEEVRVLSGKARPLYDSDCKIMGAIECIRDVTEIRKTQEKLRESEKRYRSVVENIQDIFYRTDKNGVITMISPSAAQIYGAPCEDIIGKSVDLFWVSASERAKMVKKLHGEGIVRDYEATLVRNDGSRFYASFTSSLLKDDQGGLLGDEGIIRDITERKRGEEERLRLAMAVEQAAEGIMITDAYWRIEYANPAFQRITGYAGEQILGRYAWFFKDEKDDKALDLELSAALRKGEAWSGRMTNKKKDGALYDADVSVSAILDGSGDVRNYVVLHRDISRELLLEKELRQAQKMEALGTLAGGIAHDFNNILGAISGYTELAKLELGEQNPVRSKLAEVLKATLRAKELVQQILVFSRRSEQKKMPLPLRRILEEAMLILRPSLPSTIEIKTDVSSKNAVLADSTQMHQVLMNLCTNAAHAMQDKGGVLEVRLADITMETEVSTPSGNLPPGPYVELRVSDVGQGMEAPIMDLIFDPFFTTKGPHEGTGLGLSVVHGIVKSHGGAISVESIHGVGTTFRVLLPALETEGAAEKKDEAEVPLGGRERVLVVDDEPILAEMIKEMLEKLGYEAVSCTSGMQALETFKEQPAKRPFDLVLTDMTMPGLTGLELARELLDLEPRISVVLMTGFSRSLNMDAALELGVGEVIMKPVTLEKLAKTVRVVLDRRLP
ncbi:MAG: PAS domain S-box protein [Syntrophobacteraceae bacterium]